MEQRRGALITHFGCSLLKSRQAFRFPLSLFKFTDEMHSDWAHRRNLADITGGGGQNRGPLIYEEVGKIRLNLSLIQTHPFPPPPAILIPVAHA